MDRLKGIAGGISMPYGSRNRETTGGQGVRAAGQPGGKSVSQSAGQPGSQSMPQSAGAPGSQSMPQSAGLPGDQNVPQSAGLPGGQSIPQAAEAPESQGVSQAAGIPENQNALRQDGTAEIQNAWLPYAAQGGQSVRQADLVQEEEKVRPGWHRPPRAVAKGYGSRNPYRMGERSETEGTREAYAKDEEAGALSQTKAKKEEDARKAWILWKEAEEKRRKDEEEKNNSFLNKLKEQAEAFKRAMDPKKQKNLYDATMDLTLLAQIEKIPGLKAMQSRLMFQIRSVKASRAENSEIRAAVTKLKKVIGKVKAKVKSLEKEALMEKKRKRAQEARRKAKERALRRELEWRRKARKAKEQKDIEESKMGLGANYGGPTGDPALEIAMEAYASMDSAAMAADVGAAVDVAVADVGAAPVDGGAGAVDVSL